MHAIPKYSAISGGYAMLGLLAPFHIEKKGGGVS
jgi:hypothetical protein